MRTAAFFPALAAYFSLTSAQNYPDQSAPFTLKITTTADPSLDGKYLYACHSGAAIEQLCPGDKSDAPSISGTYYLNTSSWLGPDTGALIWNLPYNGDQIASSALVFSYNPVTNVVPTYFIPGDTNAARVGFDADNKLFVPAYVDDVTTPNGEERYYHWEVCNSQFGGYRYRTLQWVTVGNPINTSCREVNVTRESI